GTQDIGNTVGWRPAAQRAKARGTVPPRLPRSWWLKWDYVLDAHRSDGTEDCFHYAGPEPSEGSDVRTVPAVWDFAQDGLQVAQAIPRTKHFGSIARVLTPAIAQSAADG